jgi:hypothetical protein
MSTDDLDFEIACILADCVDEDDLQQRIIKHAHILQRLVCSMVRDREYAGERIRTVYSELAELAVQRIEESRPFPRGKLH